MVGAEARLGGETTGRAGRPHRVCGVELGAGRAACVAGQGWDVDRRGAVLAHLSQGEEAGGGRPGQGRGNCGLVLPHCLSNEISRTRY